jgi:hypothetical protein
MHPSAAGPDTLQGNASECWWIAHSMMRGALHSMMISCTLLTYPQTPAHASRNSANSDAFTCYWARHMAGYCIRMLVYCTLMRCGCLPHGTYCRVWYSSASCMPYAQVHVGGCHTVGLKVFKGLMTFICCAVKITCLPHEGSNGSSIRGKLQDAQLVF